MKRFSDFAKDENITDGEKIKLVNILNKEILIVGYKIKTSQFQKTNSNKYLLLQFVSENKKYVAFTGSSVLADQIEKYKDEIPFTTTIVKIDKYFTFS